MHLVAFILFHFIIRCVDGIDDRSRQENGLGGCWDGGCRVHADVGSDEVMGEGERMRVVMYFR